MLFITYLLIYFVHFVNMQTYLKSSANLLFKKGFATLYMQLI